MLKLLKSGDTPESAIHKSLMQWVRLDPLLKKLVMHFPNEGKRTIHYGRYLKELGMRSGVSDLFIAMARHGYHGAWIELKSKNGILSPEQKAFLADMSKQGYFSTTCWSLDEAISTIKWYCFQNGTSSIVSANVDFADAEGLLA